MKSINFPQAIVLLACIAAPIAAYKLLGSPEAAAASMVVGMVLNFLLGRDGGPGGGGGGGSSTGDGPPALRALPGGKSEIVSMLGLSF
jgi:hypothetical protein